MRCILFTLLVCGAIALVQSEVCTTNQDCASTQCAAGSSVICEHPTGSDGVSTNGGLCTCATNSCMSKSDCLQPAHPELTCNDDRRHCYDNRCICSRFGSGMGK